MKKRSCTLDVVSRLVISRRVVAQFVVALSISVLVVAQLACGQPAEEWQLRGWTVTPNVVVQPSQTSVVVQETVIVVAQETVEVVVQVTPTPARLCVVAQVAVNLRPSPSDENYPILELPKDSDLLDLRGRDGKWWFVQYEDKQGWVDSNYISENCN